MKEKLQRKSVPSSFFMHAWTGCEGLKREGDSYIVANTTFIPTYFFPKGGLRIFGVKKIST